MRLAVVPQGHPLRATTETFIRGVYRETYGAQIDQFAPLLVASLDDTNVQCAAGLRFEEDGFFSERYLDQPVDRILTGLGGVPIWRDEIFEVTSLASQSPSDVPRFFRQIAAFGKAGGFQWAFFTATERVQRLLTRMKLPMNTLSAADPARVERPEQWGSYYSARPVVLASSRENLASSRCHERQEARHV